MLLLQTLPDHASSGTPETVAQVALFLLLPFVAMFGFIIFIFYRQNREQQLRKQKLELELKALRAQMNPHFMFNCLNSIYHSINANRNQEAGEYLMKFAYLTRRILENSNQRWIALSEEVELLRAYLDLERMRGDRKFQYTIEVHPDLDADNTSVLMLLVQPFLENSILHAFGPEQTDAAIDITIKAYNGKLLYTLIDNGTRDVERPAAMDNGKRMSMGLSLVRDQLNAVKLLEKGDATYYITGGLDEHGKHRANMVQLYLPLLPLH